MWQSDGQRSCFVAADTEVGNMSAMWPTRWGVAHFQTPQHSQKRDAVVHWTNKLSEDITRITIDLPDKPCGRWLCPRRSHVSPIEATGYVRISSGERQCKLTPLLSRSQSRSVRLVLTRIVGRLPTRLCTYRCCRTVEPQVRCPGRARRIQERLEK